VSYVKCGAGEQIVIPEWAVDDHSDGYGLGDDPYFIDNMYNWFLANHVPWVIYFVDDAADNLAQNIDFLLTDGSFHLSLKAFEGDSGKPFAARSWKPCAPPTTLGASSECKRFRRELGNRLSPGPSYTDGGRVPPRMAPGWSFSPLLDG
jgi:hypothetical protein